VDSSDEWIRRRTGISTRRFAGPDETLAVMAASAAGKALAQSGLAAAQVDCVIAATMSQLRQAPPLAPEIAGMLGAACAAAFDVAAACAGFSHALAVAAGLVSAGTAEHVVVVGTERMSDVVDPADRATSFIFGDGAGAAVVVPATRQGIGAVAWGSYPPGLHWLDQTSSWLADDGRPQRPYLRMSGPEIYRWVTGAVPGVARQALARAGLAAADLAAFIPHQANLRISAALAAALELPGHVRVADDVVDMGNTSAASIPLAMERLLATGEVSSGAPALLVGFGSGLSYSAQVAWLP
jgi:3-oxoacyl-[acyl-carrier-protein] synthase-3